MTQAVQSEKVLDLEGVMQRLENDHELYQEITGLFLDGSAAMLDELRKAHAANDTAALGRTAHATKGALGNIGAMRAWQRAFELESIGKSGELQKASQLIAELEREIVAFKAEYERYLQEGAEPGA